MHKAWHVVTRQPDGALCAAAATLDDVADRSRTVEDHVTSTGTQRGDINYARAGVEGTGQQTGDVDAKTKETAPLFHHHWRWTNGLQDRTANPLEAMSAEAVELFRRRNIIWPADSRAAAVAALAVFVAFLAAFWASDEIAHRCECT